ncbi:thermonuclease family protein [Alkalinema sp. FACHB-956]|uniref:thermonuclease family protein n=1 Tax=Alkalinema sp. FACHB-956 TaxID=2692768 RepID=UPI0018EF7702|nr:thermonuclease family protein [Alkalinema sp. FACHB-956]
MMARILIFAGLSILLFSLQSPAWADLNAKVVSIGDGDTITVQQGNAKTTVRLACIDAAEMKQGNWGTQSKRQLQRLLPIGQTVRIRDVEKDKYGRLVGEIFVGNKSINLEMVNAGEAVVYRQYLSACPDNQRQYLNAERWAKAEKRGFWNQANPVMPWDFRHGKSTTTPRTQPQQQFPACVRSDCDCKDFSSREEAEAVFRAFPGDPFRLDGDRDGIPCESLR